MSHRSNNLNLPNELHGIPNNGKPSIQSSHSKQLSRDSLANPKLKRTVSQLFHGTRKWGSFSKSTINKNRSSITGINFNSSNISLSEVDDNLNSFCNFFNFLPIFHPVGPLKCVWDGIVMVMLIYTSVEIPYTLSFEIDLTLDSIFGIIALSIDIFLCIDIIFNFRTAFFDKFDTLKLIINPTVIAKRYLCGWFAIDLVTSIPLDFIIPSAVGHFNNVTTYIKILRIFRLVRVVKILRLLKIVKLFDGVMKRIVVREMLVVVRLLKIISFMLLYAHLSACLWYFIGCESQKQHGVSWISEHTHIIHQCDANSTIEAHEVSSIFVRYSYSWYWSVVTLFTTGYGDITATNVYEQWVASVSILIGTCFFAYFIGTLTTLISEGDRISSEIMSKMEEAQHFCDKKKLPREMARAVLTHTRYHCNYNCILDEQSVLGNLPPYLQMDISLYISKSLMLSNIDFLNEKILDPVVRGAIAIRMRSISCNNGYKLYNKGDLAKEIYIQRTGRSIHLIETKRGKKKKMKLNRGDVCGEYSLILKKRASTVLCATWCEFYVLEINDVIEVLQQYYGNRWEKKWSKMKKFVKKEYMLPTRWRKKRHVSTQIEYKHADESEMHAIWSNDSGKTIRSTIRAESAKNNPMFQSIFNDSETVHFNSKYSDMNLSEATIIEEDNTDDMDPDLNEESLTTHSEFLELVKLDNIKQHDPDTTREGLEFDPSPSIGRTHTTSTIDEIRMGKAKSFDGIKEPKAKSKSVSLDNVKQTKSSRKSTFDWLGSFRTSRDNISSKRSPTNTKQKKKEPKKKKKKSVWFGNMRQNSELRDKAVMADSIGIDIFREMFSDYQSGTDESGSDDVVFGKNIRSKSEHVIATKAVIELNDVPGLEPQVLAQSEPNFNAIRKQRSRSLENTRANEVRLRKHITFNINLGNKTDEEQHTDLDTEPPDIGFDEEHSLKTMIIIEDEKEDPILRMQSNDSNSENTDSISPDDDLAASDSSNTLRSEPQPQSLHTSKTTVKSGASKVSGGKFKVKKHMKKGGNKNTTKNLHTTNIMKSYSNEKNVIMNIEYGSEIDLAQIHENDLPNTSMKEFTELSQVDEDILLNKSFCLSTKTYVNDDDGIDKVDTNHDENIDLNEDEDVTAHLAEVFEDNNTDNDNDNDNNNTNRANYVDD